MRRSALGFLALIATAGAAAGAELPASPEGAAKATAALSRYLGTLAGAEGAAVRLEPQDATSYRMTVDLPAIARLLGADGKAPILDLQSQSVRVAENDDGTWRVSMEGLAPISGTMGGERFSFRMDGFRFDGMWDPSLFAFRSGGTEHSSFTRTDQGAQGASTSAGGAGYASVESKPGSVGGTSSTVGTSVVDLRTTASREGLDLDMRMAKVDSVTTVESMKVQPFAELVALWVSGRESVAARSAEARGLLVAALPIFETFDQRYAIEGLRVAAKGTEVSIDGLTTQFTGTGLTQEAKFMFWYDAKGMTIRSPAIPAWAAALAPTRSNVQFDVSGHDLAALSQEAVALMDAAPGPERDARVLAVMARVQERPTVVNLMPTGFGNDLYSIAIEGLGRISKSERTTRLKVTMTGVDAVDGVLANAGDAQAVQSRAMLGVAKAYATAGENGALVWIVDYDGASVTVNGRPMGR